MCCIILYIVRSIARWALINYCLLSIVYSLLSIVLAGCVPNLLSDTKLNHQKLNQRCKSAWPFPPHSILRTNNCFLFGKQPVPERSFSVVLSRNLLLRLAY